MSNEITNKISPTRQLDSELKRLFLLSFDGDKEAYRDFLHKVTVLLKGYLFKKFYQYAYSSEIKEELVQDILLLIHRKRSAYRVDMPITPWIYTIAKHYMIDQCRKNQIVVNHHIEVEDIQNEKKILQEDKTEDIVELEQLFEKLNDKQKQILIMSKGYGYTAEEINDQTGFSISSIKVSVHRSLKTLRKGINSEG